MIKRKKVSDEDRVAKVLRNLEDAQKKSEEAHQREDAHFGIVREIVERMEPLPDREIMLLAPIHYNHFYYRKMGVCFTAEDLTENGMMYIPYQRLRLVSVTHGGFHLENDKLVYYYWNPKLKLLLNKVFTCSVKVGRVGPLKSPKKAK